MTQLQAIAFVVVLTLAGSLAVGLVMVAMTIRYEIEDRLRKRARQGTVDLTRRA